MVQVREWKLQALTAIWTGDVGGNSNRLIPTGLMGSLRWWYEVLARGLGGEACDPTVPEVRCPQDTKKKPTEPGHHCVVCELFGCTGWARKFRLMIVDENGEVIQSQIQANQMFILRFIPLRPIRDEEWCLLDLTLRLIADYGAIGGKTVLKPSEEWGIADLGAKDLEENNGRVRVRRSRHGLPLRRGDVILEVEGSQISSLADLEEMVKHKPYSERLRTKVQRSKGEQEIEVWAGKRHHQDFGLIQVVERPNNSLSCTHEQLEAYIRQERWRKNIPDQYRENGRQYDYSWASLDNFWCVKGRYLARQSFTYSSYNRVIGRNMRKNRAQDLWQDNETNLWLAGNQQESKKVFSFKEPEEARRTFGFIKPGLVDFDEMKRRLRQVWHDLNPDEEFLTGEHIIGQLFQQEESA